MSAPRDFAAHIERQALALVRVVHASSPRASTLHENPALRVLAGQLSLLDALSASAAKVERAVEAVSASAPSHATPPPPVADPLAPRQDRYTIEQSRSGFDVLDRITNTAERRAERLPPYPTREAALARLTALEAAWRALVAARFAHLSAEPERRRTLIENAIDARVLDRRAWAEQLDPPRAALPAFEPVEGERYAPGAVESVRAVRARGGALRRGGPARAQEPEACVALSADDVPASETVAPPPRVFEVLESAMPELRKKIEAWNRKAAKMKQVSVSITEGPRRAKELTLQYEVDTSRGVELAEKKVTRWVVPITVTGDVPRFNGWQLAAKLVPVGAVNVVNAVGDVPVPLRFRERVNTCEHCRSTRKRSETFVLYNEGTRRYAQVGRSCLADFLPGAGAEDIISLLEAIPLLRLEADSSMADAGRSLASGVELPAFLSNVALALRTQGWVSGAVMRDTGRQSTAERARANYLARFSKDPRVRATYVPPTAGDEAEALAAIEHWRAATPQSDLDYNLRAIAEAGMVDPRTQGQAAWMVEAYKRAVGDRAVAARAVDTRAHVGKVGAKLKTTVTVVRASELGGQYGGVAYGLKDDAGNDLTWFGKAGKLLEGRRYAIEGDVVKHGEYRGVPQTQLARVFVFDDVTDPATLPPTTDPPERLARAVWARSRRGGLGPFRATPRGQQGLVLSVGDRYVAGDETAGWGPEASLSRFRQLDPILRAAIDEEAHALGLDLRGAGYLDPETPEQFVRGFLERRGATPEGIEGYRSGYVKSDPALILGAGRGRKVVTGATPEAFVAAARAVPALAPAVAEGERFYAQRAAEYAEP